MDREWPVVVDYATHPHTSDFASRYTQVWRKKTYVAAWFRALQSNGSVHEFVVIVAYFEHGKSNFTGLYYWWFPYRVRDAEDDAFR